MAKTSSLSRRRPDALRPVRITPHFVPTADGSCLMEMGNTRVICTASFTPGVPEWMAGGGTGWLTAEYGMLPASTGKRKSRPIGKPDSRATEIQRLIGRAIRPAMVMDRLGENTICLDCDVLTADGGTRTAAITGAYVALAQAVARAVRRGQLPRGVLRGPVAAVSVGIVAGRAVLDLDYHEDASAEVDMNVAMIGRRYVEVQGTSEHRPFDDRQLTAMLRLARRGIGQLMARQRKIIAAIERAAESAASARPVQRGT